jgi:hypothetical protein
MFIIFNQIDKKLTELKIKNKPSNIFNADESGFMCQKGKKRVFCRRGTTPYHITSNNDKIMYTVNVSKIFNFLTLKLKLIFIFSKTIDVY